MKKKSQKIRHLTGKALKLTFSIIFIFTTVLGFMFLPLQKIIADPLILNISLENQNIYGLLNENSFEIIQKMGAFQNGIGRLDPAFASQFISNGLSPKWWKAVISRDLGEYYHYFNNGNLVDSQFNYSSALKSILQNRDNEIVILEELSKYPKCTEGQKQNINLIMNGSSEIIPMCMVDDSLLSPFVDFLQTELTHLANEIPTKLRFNVTIENSLFRVTKLIRAVYITSFIFTILALCFFIALTITILGNLNTYCRWMGKVLSITGAIGIIVEIVLFLVVNSILPDAFQKLLSDLPVAIIQPIIKAIMQGSTVFVYYYGLSPIAISAIGLLFLIIPRINPGKQANA